MCNSGWLMFSHVKSVQIDCEKISEVKNEILLELDVKHRIKGFNDE